MRFVRRRQVFTALFTLATVIYAIRTNRSHGTFLRVPFEFRLPTPRRIKERWWNPEDDRWFTPHVFGVGWSLNLYQVCKRLGLSDRHDDDALVDSLDEGH